MVVCSSIPPPFDAEFGLVRVTERFWTPSRHLSFPVPLPWPSVADSTDREADSHSKHLLCIFVAACLLSVFSLLSVLFWLCVCIWISILVCSTRPFAFAFCLYGMVWAGQYTSFCSVCVSKMITPLSIVLPPLRCLTMPLQSCSLSLSPSPSCRIASCDPSLRGFFQSQHGYAHAHRYNTMLRYLHEHTDIRSYVNAGNNLTKVDASGWPCAAHALMSPCCKVGLPFDIISYHIRPVIRTSRRVVRGL